MTQAFRRLLEFLELDPDKLGVSPFPANAFLVPRVLRLEGTKGEEGIVWAELDWERADPGRLVAIQAKLNGAGGKLETPDAVLAFLFPFTTPTSNMLGAFIRIRDEHDVLKFAKHYGPLRLCMHGVPAGPSYSPMWVQHHPHFKLRPWCEPVRVEGLPATATAAKWLDMQAELPVAFFQEKVSDWLRFVRVAQALLSIGLAGRAADAGNSYGGGKPVGERVDWETLFREWFRSPGPERSAINVVDNLAHGRGLVRILVESITNQWISMGQVRPSLEWRGSEASPHLDFPANTFGHLGLQLATTLASAKNFKFCVGCGSPFPRMGRATYCQGCQDKGEPARDRKRRFRELHPNSDHEYRLRKAMSKGDSR